MGIGTSIVLIAVGAILRWAVADEVSGVDLSVIGLILLVVGVIGLVISLFATSLWSRGRGRDRETVYRERGPRYR
jgi:uncharacterized protein DUF6458